MGDSETGGGGSVYWNLVANNVLDGESHDKKVGNGRQQDGRDLDGAVGDFFTVSIKLPANGSSVTMTPDPNDRTRVFFNLPIGIDPKQIRISWGVSPNHRGIGGPGPKKP
jgi:hypothetical protein